jgi:hypothetical protein
MMDFDSVYAADRAAEEGAEDAINGLPCRLPAWIADNWGTFSEVAQAYDDAYNEAIL